MDTKEESTAVTSLGDKEINDNEVVKASQEVSVVEPENWGLDERIKWITRPIPSSEYATDILYDIVSRRDPNNEYLPVEVVSRCLEKKFGDFNINFVHPVLGRTALHEAAKRGRLDVILELLKAGADPFILDGTNMSPFEVALSLGLEACSFAFLPAFLGDKCALLKEFGSSAFRNDRMDMLLEAFSLYDTPKVFEAFVKAFPDVGYIKDRVLECITDEGYLIVHQLAKGGSVGNFKVLIDQVFFDTPVEALRVFFNMATRDEVSLTPLLISIIYKRLSLAKYLTELKREDEYIVDIWKKAPGGKSFLHVLCEMKGWESRQISMVAYFKAAVRRIKTEEGASSGDVVARLAGMQDIMDFEGTDVESGDSLLLYMGRIQENSHEEKDNLLAYILRKKFTKHLRRKHFSEDSNILINNVDRSTLAHNVYTLSNINLIEKKYSELLSEESYRKKYREFVETFNICRKKCFIFKNDFEMTALHYLANYGVHDAVRHLLETYPNKLRAYDEDIHGLCPLDYCILALPEDCFGFKSDDFYDVHFDKYEPIYGFSVERRSFFSNIARTIGILASHGVSATQFTRCREALDELGFIAGIEQLDMFRDKIRYPLWDPRLYVRWFRI